MTLRVLIADDQELVRAGLRTIIDAEPDMEVVAEAGDGAQALQHVRQADPDLVLMDIRMPGVDGVEATRRIFAGASGPHPRVLILTTFDRNEYVYEALRAGASGFLLKDMPAPELVMGLRAAARGEALLAPSITRRLIEEFTETRAGAPPPELEELTPREMEIFRLIAEGLSNAEIAQQLVLSGATVKTHVAHLLAKLELRDRVQAVVLAYRAGVVRPERRPLPPSYHPSG